METTINTLLSDAMLISGNIKNLAVLSHPKQFQIDDLQDNTKTLEAIKVVLDYYGCDTSMVDKFLLS